MRNRTNKLLNADFNATESPSATKEKPTKEFIAPLVKVYKRRGRDKVQEPVRFNFYVHNRPSVLLEDLTCFSSENVDLVLLLHETSEVLKITTEATGVNLYMVDGDQIYQSQKNFQGERHKVKWKIQKGSILAAYVAFTKMHLVIDDLLSDERFPDGLGYNDDDTVGSVLCIPIVTPDSECCAVIELTRDPYISSFTKEDLKIAIVVAGWVGAAINQNLLRVALQRQQQINDYLLDLTKCYFAETLTIEDMITEIIKFAKASLAAEKGTFFIVDEDTQDLVAEVFEEGVSEAEVTMHRKSGKIQLAKEKSIAGLVARSRITVNIRDACNDPRFISEVEEKTEYVTRSILCMPIVSVDHILGVVQVVNKIKGACFTPADENLFKTFSVYCALALHYKRLRQKMFKTDKINKTNLRLLKIQLKPCPHDMEMFVAKPGVDVPPNFTDFKWYVSPTEFADMPQLLLYMITEVVGREDINQKALMEFILSVRKCYRNNYYHNFEHAFSVTHCMYNIVRRNRSAVTDIEVKSLMLAALCHDLDHAGFTNNYLQLIDDTLAQLYDESILENHHYRIAMTILSGVNVFNNLTVEDFELISKEMKEAILATDLASYFKYRVKLIQLINDNLLDLSRSRHRTLIKAIMMTCCDLSGSNKTFTVGKIICENVLNEFYRQGDLEKKMGLTPLSLMDRDKSQMVPEDQVQFISVIVLPSNEMLANIFPNTIDLYNEASLLKKTWQEIINLRGQKSWRHDSVLNK